MLGPDGFPVRPDRRLVLQKQRLFPQQTDGQKIGDRGVGVVCKLGAPEFISRDLCPTAKRPQELMEIGVERVRAETEPVNCARDRIGRGLRGVSDKGREPAYPP